MSTDQIIVFSTIILALVFFIWGKFRHDIIAIICLLILVVLNVIPTENAFSGFAHPAVITVAAILVVSHGFKNSGLIDLIGKWINKLGNKLILQVSVLSLVVCVASAFMNNVGALAVIMPVAIHIAVKNNRSPSLILMPIAFASLLGGMITLIGTPPNIIIATFRQKNIGESFSMFDFAPVGIGIALVGLIFISLFSWRLLPKRIGSKSQNDRFSIEDYITEVFLSEDSVINGLSLLEIHKKIDADIQILNVVRNRHLFHAPDMSLHLKLGDILTIEGDSDDLKSFVEQSKTKLVGKGEHEGEVLGTENISNIEAVVMAESQLCNQSAASLQMRSRFGVNLLAISRQGHQIHKRIDHVNFKVGDVLLLQGDTGKIDDVLKNMGCLPLADRGFNIGKPRRIIVALLIFIISIALVISGLLKVEIAFTLAALLMVLTRLVEPREVYTSIDWPIIVLLGALLPLGTALETSGGADLLAQLVLSIGQDFSAWFTLSILFLICMLLSNVINNAATVVLMAPIAMNISNSLQVSADPFLMCVAVASSAAFMTPIGHQSNTLVMGPGGYKFSDYTKLGIPMSIIVGLISIPLILWFWPLK